MAENQGQQRFGTGPGTAEKARDVPSSAVETVRGTAKEWASNVADAAQGVGSGIAQGTERAYKASRDAVVGAEQSVEEFIRRHPVPVVLGALVVGCMVGCAMSRRD